MGDHCTNCGYDEEPITGLEACPLCGGEVHHDRSNDMCPVCGNDPVYAVYEDAECPDCGNCCCLCHGLEEAMEQTVG